MSALRTERATTDQWLLAATTPVAFSGFWQPRHQWLLAATTPVAFGLHSGHWTHFSRFQRLRIDTVPSRGHCEIQSLFSKRTRLTCLSWTMMASIQGYPVLPSFHACHSPIPLGGRLARRTSLGLLFPNPTPIYMVTSRLAKRKACCSHEPPLLAKSPSPHKSPQGWSPWSLLSCQL